MSAGHEVMVRPLTTPASIRVHGPWQMTPAAFEKTLHELHRFRIRPQLLYGWIGFATAVPSNVVARDLPNAVVERPLLAFRYRNRFPTWRPRWPLHCCAR